MIHTNNDIRFVPTSKERSVDKKVSRTVVAPPVGNKVLSKAKLLLTVKQNIHNNTEEEGKKQVDNSLCKPSTDGTSQIPGNLRSTKEGLCAQSNPLRSSHLWSKKSFDMYKRLKSYVNDSRLLPQYGIITRFSKADPMGVIETYCSTKEKDAVELYYNEWGHYKSRFEIAKVYTFYCIVLYCIVFDCIVYTYTAYMLIPI